MAKKAANSVAKGTKKNQAAAVKAETKKATKKVRQSVCTSVNKDLHTGTPF